MEEFLQTLQTLDPLLVYTVVFGIAFIENIFPPFPSDVVVVFAGSLVVLGHVDFTAILILATAGSTLGFLAMYKIGDWFGDHILEQGKISFIPAESVRKVEAWFARYGYWIIVFNRFLAGTRAVVSFFAGLSELHLGRTVALSFISALAWNAILVSAGFFLGHEWEKIGFYLTTYSQVVTAIIIIVVIMLIARFLYKKKNGNTSQTP
jgi:membrane protein DedA with SNARE-associated domain